MSPMKFQHSVMKPFDAVSFNIRKALREVNNVKSDNFEMEILDESALDKVLEGPEKIQTGKIWKTSYEFIDDKYFKQSYYEFPKEVPLKYKQEFNVSHFIPVHIKKAIQQIGLEY